MRKRLHQRVRHGRGSYGSRLQRRLQRRLRFGTVTALVASTVFVASPRLEVAGAVAPDEPVVVAPAAGATGVSTDVTLSVDVTDPDGGTLDVSFYGQPVGTDDDFTVIALPDTQHYSDSATDFQLFIDQTQWILDERVNRNIVLVDQLGDIVENGSFAMEWSRAAQALLRLNQNDIAVGIAPGNHDYNVTGVNSGPADLYDANLPALMSLEAGGIQSYERHGWYGGYMGGTNDAVTADDGVYTDRLWKNNYVLFSAGGMDFINIAIEYNFPGDTEDWVDDVLTAFPERRAIISTHQFLEDNNSISTEGASSVWSNVLIDHCNVFLVLSAHNHSGGTPGEAQRTETNSCGDAVHMRMSDYQDRANGGDGWLRIMTFDPSEDTIDVETHSPTRNGGAGDNETDANSQFTLGYDMDLPLLGTLTDVPSATTASFEWLGLELDTEYEWYAIADDGTDAIESDTATFTTGDPPEDPPDTPMSLAATATSKIAIDITWADVADETGYELEVGIDGAAAVPVDASPLPAGSTSSTYTTPPFVAGTEFCFTLRAVNAFGPSGDAGPDCATPINTPPTVTGVTITPRGPGLSATVNATAAATDGDGDATTLGYTWFIESAEVVGVTSSSLDLTGLVVDGDEVSVSVLANDGDDDSAPEMDAVTVDGQAPQITLVGPDPQVIDIGASYTELGATATDNVDDEAALTAAIDIDASAVDTATPGDYVVTYNVTDVAGNAAAEALRTVTVVDDTDPVTPPPSDPKRNRVFVANVIRTGPADYDFLLGFEENEILTGDWNGNGHDGFAARAGQNILEVDEFGRVIRTVAFGVADDTSYWVGNWDGDGVDTLGVRRGNVFHLTNSPTGAGPIITIAYGRSGDEVLVGDWDGDGVDTFAVRRGNVFHVRNSVSTGVADIVFGYGRARDEVLVGDWDSDGVDTFAVRRGNVIFIRNDFVTGIAENTIGYGKATDVLRVGDWNGDDIDTFAVVRLVEG